MSDLQTRLMTLFGVRLPIVQAPMAGGPDTPALAAAVANAGGLGSLGCGYLTAAQIATLAAATRSEEHTSELQSP